jgi:hypothetical protein
LIGGPLDWKSIFAFAALFRVFYRDRSCEEVVVKLAWLTLMERMMQEIWFSSLLRFFVCEFVS